MSDFRRYLLGLAVAFAATGFLGASAPASAEPPGGATKSANDLVLRGDAVCTTCHTAEMTPHVLEIGKTTMGTTADPRTPTCTSCHGESLKHREGNGLPDITYDKKSKTPIDVRNEACLTCHRSEPSRSHWDGSTHQSRGLACTSCHQVHTAHDKVRDKRTQPEVCFGCHKEQRGQIDRPSHHPIPEGKMACSDCHNPHGTTGRALMKRDSVNQVCYTCHMEKRGPFVHSHEPVDEDCTNCHNPHGTVTENMLKMRPPFLCHSCHTPHSSNNIASILGRQVPGNANTISTTGKNATNYAMARGCLNCHTQVHGTNNPSVADPTPQFLLR
jgi:DmsE family decaheme c-type cytochrome